MNKTGAVLATCLAGMVLIGQYQPRPVTAESQPAAQQNPLWALPTPGHPLDSRDVDILTGKADRQARGIYPLEAPYYSVYGPFEAGLYGSGVRDRSIFPALLMPPLSAFFARPRLAARGLFGGFLPSLGFVNPGLTPFRRR